MRLLKNKFRNILLSGGKISLTEIILCISERPPSWIAMIGDKIVQLLTSKGYRQYFDHTKVNKNVLHLIEKATGVLLFTSLSISIL